MGGERAGAELAVATVNLAGNIFGIGVCGLWHVDGARAGARVVVKFATHPLAGAWNRALWNGIRVSLDLHGEGLEGVV